METKHNKLDNDLLNTLSWILNMCATEIWKISYFQLTFKYFLLKTKSEGEFKRV